MRRLPASGSRACIGKMLNLLDLLQNATRGNHHLLTDFGQQYPLVAALKNLYLQIVFQLFDFGTQGRFTDKTAFRRLHKTAQIGHRNQVMQVS